MDISCMVAFDRKWMMPNGSYRPSLFPFHLGRGIFFFQVFELKNDFYFVVELGCAHFFVVGVSER